jgi:Ca2+-binding RTX toxin-like protein
MSQASVYEQYMLELINADRIKAGAQPLAFDDNLNTAAENHSLWMIDTEIFSHTGINGSNAGTRMKDAGYIFSGSWSWGENIAWSSTRSPSGFQDEVLRLHTNLMNSSGHRANILNNNFKELGVGFEVGQFKGFNSAVVTENFAKTASNPFLTGVVFNDKDKDKFYDINEGLDNITVSARNNTTGATITIHTGISGGYEIELSPGQYTVTFSDDEIQPSSYQVTIGSRNVKLDNVINGIAPEPIPTTNTINGTSGNDRLIGTSGQDSINGSDGSDTLNGRGGADVLTGGNGRDVFVINTNDGTVDKITDFSGDIILIDGTLFSNVSYSSGVLSSNGNAIAELVGAPSIDGSVYTY